MPGPYSRPGTKLRGHAEAKRLERIARITIRENRRLNEALRHLRSGVLAAADEHRSAGRALSEALLRASQAETWGRK